MPPRIAKRVPEVYEISKSARKLESHICLKIAGSKTKARGGLFNFAKFREKGREKDILLVIGPEVADLIDRLKDAGDDAAHAMRPTIHVSELKELITHADEEREDTDANERFIVLLHTYGLVDVSGRIILNDAF